MTWNPDAWSSLGRAIRSDRERQGLTREDLAERIRRRGGSVTVRSIFRLESGTVPKLRKPTSLEPTVAALGWPPGKAERILSGEPADLADDRTAPRDFSDPRMQAIWALDLPVEERVQAIRDLYEGELRRAQEQERRTG